MVAVRTVALARQQFTVPTPGASALGVGKRPTRFSFGREVALDQFEMVQRDASTD